MACGTAGQDGPRSWSGVRRGVARDGAAYGVVAGGVAAWPWAGRADGRAGFRRVYGAGGGTGGRCRADHPRGRPGHPGRTPSTRTPGRSTGATSTADAAVLEPGTTYRSSLPRERQALLPPRTRRRVERVRLRDRRPLPRRTVSASRRRQGVRAGRRRPHLLRRQRDLRRVAEPAPHHGLGRRETPGAADPSARTPARTTCRRARTTGTDPDVLAGRPGTLELVAPCRNPRLAQTGATSAPEAWNSASPTPPSGEAVRRAGRRGFDAARRPWHRASGATTSGPARRSSTRCRSTGGSSCHATAELGSVGAAAPASWPARSTCPSTTPCAARVDDDGVGYDGSQKSAALDHCRRSRTPTGSPPPTT